MEWICEPVALLTGHGRCLVHWECARFCTPHRRKEHRKPKRRKGKKRRKVILV